MSWLVSLTITVDLFLSRVRSSRSQLSKDSRRKTGGEVPDSTSLPPPPPTRPPENQLNRLCSKPKCPSHSCLAIVATSSSNSSSSKATRISLHLDQVQRFRRAGCQCQRRCLETCMLHISLSTINLVSSLFPTSETHSSLCPEDQILFSLPSIFWTTFLFFTLAAAFSCRGDSHKLILLPTLLPKLHHLPRPLSNPLTRTHPPSRCLPFACR